MSVAFKPEVPFPAKEPFGKPGVEPRWSRGAKQGVGTALSDNSKVWFTIADGIVTEVYYPAVDTANIKDLRLLITDSRTFFDEEGRDTSSKIEYVDDKAPAFIVTNTARSGAYRVTKKILTDPASNSFVMNVAFKALKGRQEDYKLYLLLAPHIKNMGLGNSGRCANYGGFSYLLAWREDIALALTSDVPFFKMSAGYSGHSDGWHDINDNYAMDWEFERAEDGNIALTAEVPSAAEFTIVIGFGRDEIEAVLEANKALAREFRQIERDYLKGWRHYLSGLDALGKQTADKGRRFLVSAMMLKAHEDKTHKGGLVASLSIPWGEAKGKKEEATGYHLTWPRDLVKCALGFMAMGDAATALDTLKYLRSTQSADGSWPQNLWIDGKANLKYVQLDEVALPIILAWRLRQAGEPVSEFYPMVKNAASYILRNGPVTDQERWEENMGFSPSTLAAEVAALVCAAHWAREAGDERDAAYLFSIADHWSTSIERWTFSECDCLGENIPGHYLRIVGDLPDHLSPEERGLCHALVYNRNRPMDVPHHQGELVDASFLDLVRFGVRAADDPHIVSSLKVVDRMIRFESPKGVAFYRFNGDGYGEKEDGSPFDGSGVGRPWPLITGERAMYETLAGKDPDHYLKSFEGSANEGLMFPEQVWDRDDIPEKRLFRGEGTGSAAPLVWAHAEYIKLLRTLKDWKGCDLIDEVKTRYADERTRLHMAAWTRPRPVYYANANDVIRVSAFEKADLVWTSDGWATKSEDPMKETGLGIHYIDFKPGRFQSGTKLIFTFHYAEKDRWEGRNYEINIY